MDEGPQRGIHINTLSTENEKSLVVLSKYFIDNKRLMYSTVFQIYSIRICLQ